MEFETFRLPNGLRVVLQQAISPVSHACILVEAGSRDELESHHGLAHFIEHLLFKRTERRSTVQIINRLESVGADLNAYTTKEYTCLHASFLSPYLERTLDLFEDLLFHSLFPQEELDKERQVIIDEIASYQDSPEDAILDDFEDLLFSGHGLGHNILGTTDDVRRLNKSDLLAFMARHYRPERMVIGVSGPYAEKKVRRLVEKLFGMHPPVDTARTQSTRVLTSFASPQNLHHQQHRPINQVHYVLGGTAYGLHDPKKTGLLLLNNLLGGMGMGSRLNLSVREKHGIAYTIESSYTPFSDVGLFTVYFGTDVDKYQRARDLVLREFAKLRKNPLGTGQLHQAKKKFKGQIALGEENRLSLLIAQAKSLLDYDRVQTLNEIFDQIDQVTAAEMQEIANEILSEDHLNTLTFLPE